jgi:hypothetical protein
LARDGAIKKHIVTRATRQLTNGSFQDKRRFFQNAIKVDIIAPSQAFEELDEIHDRRHLYVHRAGFADDQYEHKYPHSGTESGWRLKVEEIYLFRAMKVLHESALHVRNAITVRYAVPTVRWEYRNGRQQISDAIRALVFVEARAKLSSVESLVDLEAVLPGIGDAKVRNLVVWAATDGEHLRWLLSGEPGGC